MSQRPVSSRASAIDAVNLELMAEKAEALGRSALKAETALRQLAALGAGEGPPAERADLLKAAATAVWFFFIQREVCGFRDQRPVIAQYAIPREILTRLGAF